MKKKQKKPGRKKSVAEKKLAVSNAFSFGHPAGLSPTAVLNYGGFGTDDIAVTTYAVESDPREGRLRQLQEKTSGIPGGKITPPDEQQ